GYSSHAELWEAAKEDFTSGEEDVCLDGDIWQRVLIEHLEDAGAFDLPEPLMDSGAPGMTSSMSLLFAETPPEVVETAYQQLSNELKGTVDFQGTNQHQ
ncbi:MAG: hypothetical protein ACX93P_01485, partial [Roseovarius sp.]